MEWSIPENERVYLREQARRVAEYAALPIMAQRKQMWYDLNDARQLPHLKKVSISRWCNQRFMGEALRGTEIVYSRKPDPNFLSVDETLNETAWAAHIRETLEATRGVFVEIIVRDVYTVHGNLNNPRRAVEIARHYGA